MFFLKNRHENAASLKPITIIGTSPLALFLAVCLQNNGCQVTLLAAKSEVENWAKNNSFTLRQPGFQNRSTSLKFACLLDEKPELCFIVSSPQDAATDLLRLADKCLRQVPLINLAVFYNQDLLKEAQRPYDAAYFKGYVSRDKNILQLIGQNAEIEICCDAQMAANIKSLFEGTPLALSFVKGDKNWLWRRQAPFILANLAVLAYGAIGAKFLSGNDMRDKFETAVKEICQLAQKHKVVLDSAQVLADVYMFPEGYKSEFMIPRAFGALTKILVDVERQTYPTLYALLAAAVKKY